MKITVLDGFTLNPGDLDWAELEMLGDLKVYDRTEMSRTVIIERCKDSEIILTNKTPMDSDTINSLPELKYIGVLATGFNVVDIKVAEKRGIPVTNIPTYGTDSVAQMVFAHILNFCHGVESHSQQVKSGKWAQSEDFCFWNRPLIELAGKTIGIIGFGRIGRRIGELGHAFGMKVLAQDVVQTRAPDWPGFAWCNVEEVLKGSDFVSLNCPLTPENTGMINAAALRLMKPTAFLLNLSRGPLVVEEDLAEALKKGVIAGAGIDVMFKEPPAADNRLMSEPKISITPHIAWATREARSRLLNAAVSNVKAFLDGRKENIVNGV